jgi:hypothetical protein
MAVRGKIKVYQCGAVGRLSARCQPNSLQPQPASSGRIAKLGQGVSLRRDRPEHLLEPLEARGAAFQAQQGVECQRAV